MITTTATSNWTSSSLHDPLYFAPTFWPHVARTNSFEERPHIAVPRLTTHLSVSTPKQEQPHAVTLHSIEHVHLNAPHASYNQRSAQTDQVTSNVRAGQLSQPLQVFTDAFLRPRKRLGVKSQETRPFFIKVREADQRILPLVPRTSISVLNGLAKALRPIDSRQDRYVPLSSLVLQSVLARRVSKPQNRCNLQRPQIPISACSVRLV